MSWNMKASPWTRPVPTPPSTPRPPTPPRNSPRPWTCPLSRPARIRSLSCPVSLPLCSPESCPVRGCLSPSTWSALCPRPSRCAPTSCPSTGPVWRTGTWSYGFSMVRNLSYCSFIDIHTLCSCSVCWCSPCCHPPQTLQTPQRNTPSWASPPSWPSWDHTPSSPSFSAWSHCELLWWLWWRSWRTETCSASCGDADRYGSIFYRDYTGLQPLYSKLENIILQCFIFQDNVDPPCQMTERRIFTMAKQVASALVSITNVSSPFSHHSFDFQITDMTWISSSEPRQSTVEQV